MQEIWVGVPGNELQVLGIWEGMPGNEQLMLGIQVGMPGVSVSSLELEMLQETWLMESFSCF
jgi:hypothetical protein